MSNIRFLLSLALLALAFGAGAQSTTTTFEVGGNCNMCKKRIEAAAQGKGVVKAEWNVETHQMTLEYEPGKTTAMKVQKRIAAAGHDTVFAKAKGNAYASLPACCRYERLQFLEKPKPADDGHDHVH